MKTVIGAKPFDPATAGPEPLFRPAVYPAGLHSGFRVGKADAEVAGKKGLAEGLGTHLSSKGGSQEFLG